MSVKKSQHFVPIFYLKNFAIQKNKKAICLFNITTETFIPFASIKHQACSTFFYGKDGIVEENLSILESIFSKIVSDIINTKKLPSTYSKEHFLLLLFIMSMSSRTEYSGQLINETIDKTYKTIYKDDPRFKDFIQDLQIGLENPASFSLCVSLQFIPLTLDLEFKLLINNTSTSFLTSDNPLIRYNQFLEFKNAFGSITGYGVKGIQMMIPIGPKIYIIFFDPFVYKIGNRKQKIIYINNNKDIDSLNMLQLINASKNVYFDDSFNQNYITTLFNSSKKHFRIKKINTISSSFYYDSEGNKRKLFGNYIEDIKVNLNLSFIKILKKAKKYDLGNKVVHPRSEKIIKIFDLISQKFKIKE